MPEDQQDVHEKKYSGYIVAWHLMARSPAEGSQQRRIEELDRHAVSAAVKSSKGYRGRVWSCSACRVSHICPHSVTTLYARPVTCVA
jgi:hypothetical protein